MNLYELGENFLPHLPSKLIRAKISVRYTVTRGNAYQFCSFLVVVFFKVFRVVFFEACRFRDDKTRDETYEKKEGKEKYPRHAYFPEQQFKRHNFTVL
jgi:hypothetical protein